MSLGKGRPEVKPVERSTKVFSDKEKQVGSVKQEPVSNVIIRMHGNLLPWGCHESLGLIVYIKVQYENKGIINN